MRLDDSLVKTLAEGKSPHAYSHEIKAMAQEILERRAAEKVAANVGNSGSGSTGYLWPWQQGAPP